MCLLVRHIPMLDVISVATWCEHPGNVFVFPCILAAAFIQALNELLIA